jgi:ADP-ribosylglycohydrolase
VIQAICRSASERPDYDGEHIGWVLVALQSAFYQLLHARSFRAGLVDIVSAGGDTDTNAAIAAPLLALVHGLSAIPYRWLRRVRRANLHCYAELLPSDEDYLQAVAFPG